VRPGEDRHIGSGRNLAFHDGYGDGDAFHALLQEGVHGSGDIVRFAIQCGDHSECVTGVPDGFLDGHEQCLRSDDADGAVPPGGRRPRRVVQPMTQFLGGFDDASADLVGGVLLVVEDTRSVSLLVP
jgi:hypothetical protein